MRNFQVLFKLLFVLAWLTTPALTAAQSDDEAVVQAVLFYSPSCPHCHLVINELLIPMMDEYGDRLQIIGVDTSQPGGAQLYQAAVERYQIPEQRRGVPTLVIEEVVLVGSGEIPEQLPTLVEEGLAAGGTAWPDIPGLAEGLQAEAEAATSPTAAPAEATPSPTAAAAPTSTSVAAALVTDDAKLPPPELEDRALNPIDFTIAGSVLLGMVVALSYTTWRFKTVWSAISAGLGHINRTFAARAKSWAIPLLALAGLGVAAYLAYVEITQVEAVCGPVGECNIVQSSPYAQILGLPIAVLGLLNYLAIAILWLGQKSPANWLANLSLVGLFSLTLFGTLFSIYLTLLELFVIHAICAWCLSSAVITTILMLLVVVPLTKEGLTQNAAFAS